MRVSVGGRYWHLRFARLASDCGQIDMPGTPNKEIRINLKLDGELLLDTVVHELLHAASPELASEDWVNGTASDIARVLWRLGYRKAE